MGLGTSLFLIAVGAILRFAVSATTSGINVQTVGLILMIVGAIGLVTSLIWMTVWADRRRGVAVGTRAESPVVRETEIP